MTNLLPIQSKIYTIRNVKVMLDRDLAELYQVETRVLNQSFKRHIDRFTGDFAFQLTNIEWSHLRSQIVISSLKHGGRRYNPYVFTEYGTLMLASILKSEIAIAVNKTIVRAFVDLRQQLTVTPSYDLLLEKMKRIESEIKEVKLTQLVENSMVENKVKKLSQDVRSFSDILDDFQDGHVVVKRPEDGFGKG